MNGSPELLEFYLVEATEYVDALDQLVSSPASSPDANALLATARALSDLANQLLRAVAPDVAAVTRQPRLGFTT